MQKIFEYSQCFFEGCTYSFQIEGLRITSNSREHVKDIIYKSNDISEDNRIYYSNEGTFLFTSSFNKNIKKVIKKYVKIKVDRNRLSLKGKKDYIIKFHFMDDNIGVYISIFKSSKTKTSPEENNRRKSVRISNFIPVTNGFFRRDKFM